MATSVKVTLITLTCFLVLSMAVPPKPAHSEGIKKGHKDTKVSQILRWDYSEEKGPKTWGKTFTSCTGKRQSPIDIKTEHVITMDKQAPLQIIHEKETKVHNATMVNTGPLLVINLPDLKLSPRIEGAGLPGKYKLAKLTFNWGENKFGSEHTIDGKHFPMEMKMMFVKEVYDTKEKVLADPKGIAMFSILWDVMTHNPELDKITKKLDKVMFKGQSVLIPELDFYKFIPDMQSFYRYEGSLPVPPCAENVLWTIPTKRMYMSEEQLQSFRGIYSTSAQDSIMRKMHNNHREIQPLNKRTVYRYNVEEIGQIP